MTHITIEKEKIELALEALEKADAVIYSEYCGTGCEELQICEPAIKALEEALAKQEQGDPVGFYDASGNDICTEIPMGESGDCWQPVYTTPQQRAWVGLTHEEIDYQAKKDDHGFYFALGALWAEVKLKEKNG